MDTPVYRHDCDDCLFLGNFHTHGRRTYDLYFCAGDPTLIARSSSDGPDYISGLALVGMHPAISAAYDRARKDGHL